jgi:hypothetical protein
MGALSVPSLSLPLPSMTTTRDRAQERRGDMNHRPLSNLESCVRCNVFYVEVRYRESGQVAEKRLEVNMVAGRSRSQVQVVGYK